MSRSLSEAQTTLRNILQNARQSGEPLPLPDVMKRTGLGVSQLQKLVQRANNGLGSKDPRRIRFSEVNQTISVPTGAKLDIQKYGKPAPKLPTIRSTGKI